jgi:predicted dehydrogenase
MNYTRRQAAKTIVAFGALAPTHLFSQPKKTSPNSKLNLAAVGVGGKGWDDLRAASDSGKRHNVVALCDIDQRNGGEQPPNLLGAQAKRALGAGAAKEMFPQAGVYEDFRLMLEQKDIDAVTVTTADHMHATIAITAMELGKHVYVQKPLTQTIHESRVIRQVANETGVVTQMGNQGHSSVNYRCAVDVMRSGIVGKIREVHTWTSSPSWKQGIARPEASDPIPKGVNWDLWLGVAEPRPYVKHTYHNFNWRGWQEFGTGALGDMGCHIIDPAVWSLELGPPTSVIAKVTGAAQETYPTASTVHYTFAATPHTAGELDLYWHDGGNRPPKAYAEIIGRNRNGSLFIGEKGTVVLAHGSGIPRLYPREDFLDYSRTTLKELYAKYAAEKLDHYQVWTDAILNSRQANSHFDYAAPLNETVMVGTVAQRLPGRTLGWNAPALRFDDAEATALVRRPYRKGWAIDALKG